MTDIRKPESAIVGFLERLGRLDAGGLAQLRRSAGQRLDESSRAYASFFPLIPQWVERPADQELYFLVASLYALTTRAGEHQRQQSGVSLGKALHQLRQAQLASTGRSQNDQISLVRRFAALIEADPEQLPFRLRQLVRLLYSQQLTLDWNRLLRDLFAWNASNQRIQRRWMREYYTDQNEPIADS